jgi:hypothetical protein
MVGYFCFKTSFYYDKYHILINIPGSCSGKMSKVMEKTTVSIVD